MPRRDKQPPKGHRREWTPKLEEREIPRLHQRYVVPRTPPQNEPPKLHQREGILKSPQQEVPKLHKLEGIQKFSASTSPTRR